MDPIRKNFDTLQPPQEAFQQLKPLEQKIENFIKQKPIMGKPVLTTPKSLKKSPRIIRKKGKHLLGIKSKAERKEKKIAYIKGNWERFVKATTEANNDPKELGFILKYTQTCAKQVEDWDQIFNSEAQEYVEYCFHLLFDDVAFETEEQKKFAKQSLMNGLKTEPSSGGSGDGGCARADKLFRDQLQLEDGVDEVEPFDDLNGGKSDTSSTPTPSRFDDEESFVEAEPFFEGELQLEDGVDEVESFNEADDLNGGRNEGVSTSTSASEELSAVKTNDQLFSELYECLKEPKHKIQKKGGTYVSKPRRMGKNPGVKSYHTLVEIYKLLTAEMEEINQDPTNFEKQDQEDYPLKLQKIALGFYRFERNEWVVSCYQHYESLSVEKQYNDYYDYGVAKEEFEQEARKLIDNIKRYKS